jgi:uncharacterized membrane protein
MENYLKQKHERDAWHSDPQNWKWEIVYYNKEDKRVFVPKKNPNYGFTFNFARPAAIIVSIVAVVLLVASVVLFLTTIFK